MNQTDYSPNIPIYLQIIGKMKQQIISGKWKAGERIPSVRDLSAEFGVNPNTMQRSLSELEREGLLYSERTAGRFVTKDSAIISSVRTEYARKIIQRFTQEMKVLGYTREQIAQFLLEEET